MKSNLKSAVLSFSFLIFLSLISRAEQVVFSEINYNPRGDKPEYIEIYNLTATPKDISKWKMTEGVGYVFPDFDEADPSRTFLKKWERILLSSVDEKTLRDAYEIPASTKIYGPWEGNLDNGGESIVLEDKNGVTMAEVEYNDDGRKWPIAADGAGHTLRLINQNRGASYWKNWGASLAPDGTPGSGAAEDDGQTNKIISLGSVWKYDQSGVNNGTEWRDPNFDDSAWNEGPGIFGKEGASNKMPDPGFQTPWTTGGKYTYYLRKEFEWGIPFRSANIIMDGLFDDGIVVYLNGKEIGRNSMPSGIIDWQTPGIRGEAKYKTILESDVTGYLKTGKNVLAVEIHNERSGSSDIVFGADVAISTIPPDLSNLLVLSEIHFGKENNVDWIELHAPGQQSVSLEGFSVSSKRDFSDRISLNGLVDPGGYIAFDSNFDVEDNGNINLFILQGSTVVDAHPFYRDLDEESFQSFPPGKEWYGGDGSTKGLPNAPNYNSDIVINEIMYDAPSDGRTAEFVELYNKGQVSVNLSGWKFVDGINFEFPEGTILAAGKYLVVAANTEWMKKNYGDIPVVGNFSGQLRDSGELLRIEDNLGNLVDEVYYYPSGDWPEKADGDGSSMELKHPDMDNSSPVAWADSDESSRAQFQKFTYTDIFDRVTWSALTSGQELHMHLVGDAHMEIKNISVKRNGSGANLVKNPNTMSPDSSSAKGWVCQGTHWASFVDNGTLNLVSDGHGDNKANRAEVDLNNLTFDDNYTLTFDARWVWGKSRLIVQTLDHGFGTSFHIPIPNNLGTPGSKNSQSISSSAPVLFDVFHSPAVPKPTDRVKITAKVKSSAEIEYVRVRHRLDSTNGNGNWGRSTMYDDGSSGGDLIANDGVYTAILSNYNRQGNIAQFYVEVSSKNDQVIMMPKLGPERPAMFIVDGREMKDNLLRERLILSNYDRRALSSGGGSSYDYKFPRMSNHYFNATFIANESEIFYNAEIRKSGSPFTRDGGSSLAHGKWKLPGDRLFRERRRNVFDASGTSEGSGTPRFYDDRIARHFLYQLGHPVNEMEYVHFAVNGDAFKLRENHEPISNDFLNRNFENGSEGTLLRIDDEWRFTSDDGNARQSRNADWSYKSSDNPVQYHSEWLMRSREQDYDYSNFIEFVKAIGTRNFDEESISRMADRDMLCINAAVRGYDADWDTITLNRGKNAYFYRPKGGKWMLIHWDGDRVFGNAGETFLGGLSGIRTYFDKPYIRRHLNYYLTELLTKLTKDSALTEAWMQFETEAVAGTGISMTSSHYRNWFRSRERAAQNFIGSPFRTDFKINTKNSPTSNSNLILNGTSPSTVYDIRIADQFAAQCEWTSTTAWTLSGIKLKEGQNDLIVEGVNHEGKIVHSEEFKITKRADSPPVIFVDSSPSSRNLMMTDSIEFDASASFDPEGTEIVYSWSLTPESGTSISANQANAIISFSKPGRYILNLEINDQDGSKSNTAREIVVYGDQGFSSFKDDYLDDYWELQNIDIEDNTPERAVYNLETLEGQLHIRIPGYRDFPLGLPNVQLPEAKSYIKLTDEWKYNDKNENIGTDFSSLEYDDSGWSTGSGIFGVDTGTFPAPGLQTPLQRDSTNNLLTYYFRKEFEFNDDPIGSMINIEAILDDGARFWINGQEITRVRLPAYPEEVNWKTRASSNIPFRDEKKLLPITSIDGSGFLVEGKNLFAIDLHNSSPGSSDVVVGATLDIAAQPAGAGGGGLGGTIHPWVKRDLPDNEDWMLQTKLDLYGLQFGDFMTGLMIEVEREGMRFRYGLGNKSGNQLSVIQVTPAATTGALFSSDYKLTSDMVIRIRREANDLVFEWRPQNVFEEVYRLSLPGGSKIIDGGPFAATQTPLELNVMFDYVLLSLPSSASIHSGDLVVSELMYKPEGGEQYEFIELFNSSEESIVLDGFRFTDGDPFSEYVIDKVSIEPGSYKLLVKNLEAFKSRYGSDLDDLIIGEWGEGSLSNGGEVITLTDSEGLVVFSFDYNDSVPWPVSPDQDGTSLILLDPTSGGLSNPLNWTASLSVGGSPGRIETTSPFLSWMKNREQINPLAVKEGEVINNLLTYAFGLDLIDFNSVEAVPTPGSVIIEGEEHLSLRFLQRITDNALKYTIELSTDGKNWIDANNQMVMVTETFIEDVVKVLTYRMKEPVGSTNKTFLRVSVEYN